MKVLRVLLFLLCGLQITAANSAETFASANDSYNKKDFGAAIQVYESLLRRGENRPEIHYNLGLAHEKAANPARAILSFERALLLAPNLADAQAHLDALGSTPAHWWEKLPRLGTRLSVIGMVLGAWLFLLALAAYWRALWATRHLWSVAAVLGLLVCGIAAASFYLRDYPLASPDRAIVLKSEKLRSNFTASAPTVLSLRPGQAVRITSINGPWTECILPDETRGWVATASLERVVPQS